MENLNEDTQERAEDTSADNVQKDVVVDTCQKYSEIETPADAIIANLEKQNADWQDKYLRKAADFDNYRKRMAREKQEAVDFANRELLLDLVPIIDDFERAINASGESAKSEKNFETLRTGIVMTEQRLFNALETKWGLKRFDAKGEPFDPARHEALQCEKSPAVQEPTVKEVFLKGYTLKNRVIRPAKVAVLMPMAEGEN